MSTSLDEEAQEDSPFVQVTATQLIRPLRGTSRSILVLADDSFLYIVKFANNPAGPNVLANEHLGKLLCRAVGLPAAREVFVYVPEFLLGVTFALWNERWPSSGRPRPGIHYGTEYVGALDGSSQSYDILPSALFHRVANRSDFVGMLILDIWANHQNHRQAVFSVATVDRLTMATFIDDGDMFGGPQNVFDDTCCKAFYLEPKIYSGMFDMKLIEGWKHKIYEAAPAVLLRSFEYVPHNWYDYRHKSIRMILAARLAQLDRLVEPFTSVLRGL